MLKLAREDTSLGNNEDGIGPWPGTDYGGNRTLLFPRPEPIEGMDLGTQASVDSGELLSEFCNPPGLMFSLGPHCAANDQAGFWYLLLAKAPAVGQNVLGLTTCPVRPLLLSVFPLAVLVGCFPSSFARYTSMAPAYQAGAICLLILQFTKKKDRKFLSLPKSPNMRQSIEPRSV